jgi:regulatory protein
MYMDSYSYLLNSCLKILSVRPRSVAEVKTFLAKKTSDQDLINQIIEKLLNLKFLDDQKFAAWLIESRSRTRPRGSRLLVQELKSKGIDPITINNNLLTTNNEQKLAENALSKKLDRWKDLPARDFRVKAINYLRARGFNWDAIEKAVKKGYNDEDES